MINSWTFFWLVSGELSGTINLVLSCLGSLCRWTAYPYLLPPGEDFSICKTVEKYYYVYPFRRKQESAPSLHYCFLTIAPLSLCISSIPWWATVWTQGRRRGEASVPRSLQVLPLSVSLYCLTLCHTMGCSLPGIPVWDHHHLPELKLDGYAQTHIHRVSDAIQPSHPLSPPSPPALNVSQHQGLF